ncbi:MAG: Ig-like domain-containing protein [Planctomycetes bacterium]|nr:Ig-like domain-containing protein [Planctomycetota bacterium]
MIGWSRDALHINRCISRLFAICIGIASLCAGPAFAVESVTVTSPVSGAIIGGGFSFQSSLSPGSTTTTVEYRLNGGYFSGELPPPFAFAWHAAYAANGSYTVQAVAHDDQGAEVAVSPVVAFTLAPRPEGGGIVLTAPDLSTPLSGTVTFTAQVTLAPGRVFERAIIVIDGRQPPVATSFSLGFSASFDTTVLADGTHEVVVEAFDALGQSWVGLVQRPFTVANGHVLRELRCTYRTLYFIPGESATIAARAVFADGLEEAIASGATFSSSDASIAAVDAAGVVTAVAVGDATVSVAARGRTRQVTVHVDQAHRFAHLSKGGGPLTVYDPQKSLFMRSVFFLGEPAMSAEPRLAAAMQAAAVNTMEDTIYYNPIGLTTPDYESWRTAVDVEFTKKVAAAKANGFGLFFAGDEIDRTAPALHHSIDSTSYGPRAVRHAFDFFIASGVQVGIDMVDEVNFMWGDTPTPNDGRWLSRSPPIPDDAFTALMSTIALADPQPRALSLGWPVSLGSAQAAANWMLNRTISDHVTAYWDYILENRYVYPWRVSLAEGASNMDLFIDTRYRDRGMPLLALGKLTGFGYAKGLPADTSEFVPGKDSIERPGGVPLTITADIMYQIVKGAAGVREYAYDTPSWRAERANSGYLGGLQQGADPFGIGTDRWAAMAAAFQVIAALEADLLQPMANAPDLGNDLAVCVKRGQRGALVIAVNMSEAAQRTRLELASLRAGANGAASRYRLIGSRWRSATIGMDASADVVIAPGETVIWRFMAGTDPHTTASTGGTGATSGATAGTPDTAPGTGGATGSDAGGSAHCGSGGGMVFAVVAFAIALRVRRRRPLLQPLPLLSRNPIRTGTAS